MKIDQNLNKNRGKRLRECRTGIPGMTQEKLAELCGCSIQHISLIENGKRGLTRDFAHEFASHLKVSDEYLLYETEYKTTYEEVMAKGDDITAKHECLIEYLKMLGIEVDYDGNKEYFHNHDEFFDLECDIDDFIRFTVSRIQDKRRRKENYLDDFKRNLIVNYRSSENISRKQLLKDLGMKEDYFDERA